MSLVYKDMPLLEGDNANPIGPLGKPLVYPNVRKDENARPQRPLHRQL